MGVTPAAASGPAGSQHRGFIIDTWETEQGIPENSATAMVQTPDGYLWFGTFHGLVRFDGVRFEVLNPSNTPGLPGRGVVNLHLDRRGRLWVSTLSGLAIREGSSWRAVGESQGESGDVVRSFSERADGAILLTTFDGRLLKWLDGELKTIPTPTGEQRQSVGAVDGEGRWWIVHDGYVGAWDGSAWATFGERPASDVVLGCATARDGGMWIVVGQELRKYRGNSLVSVSRLSEPVGGIWSMYEDSRHNLWICTFDRGICRVSPDGVLERWDSTSGLAYDGVRFAFEDRERNVWVGTSGGGLSRFRARRAQGYGIESGLSERVVKSVWPEANGGVLVATYGRGLFRLTGEVAEPVVLPGLDGSSLYVQSVVQDRNERTWIGTFGLGLIIVDGGFSRRIEEAQTGGDNIIAMFEDSTGRMWVSGGRAIASFEHGATRVFETGNDAPLYGVSAFAEDNEGRILATNQRGVFRLEGDRFVELSDPQGGSLRGVLCLKPTDEGTVWMGTADVGLLRWRAGQLDRVGASVGLLSTSVHGILEDRRGYWWMPSERGVVRVARSHLESAADGSLSRIECQVLTKEDGLMSSSCSSGRQPVCGIDPAGKFWFATDRGVAALDPENFERNGVPPSVHIEALSYLGASPSLRDGATAYIEDRTELAAPFDEGVTVPAGSRSLEFRFSAPSFVSPTAVRFEVRLDGLDRGWNDVGTQRLMVYHGLAPGAYTFRVRASNNDGVWNEAGDSLSLVITPYFWQTGWFQILGVLSLAGVSSGSAWWFAHAKATQRRRIDANFRKLVEAAPNAMILIDHTGAISLLNAKAEQEFGWTRATLIGKPIETVIPDPHDAFSTQGKEAGAPMRGARAGGSGIELAGRRRDGGEFPLEMVVSSITTSAGTSLLASIVNVSERKQRDLELARQRSELAHLSRVSVLGELSGAIAHELNQPLTAILSNAQAAQQIMSRDPLSTAEIQEILTDIVEQDKRAGDIIHRLRALLTRGEMTTQSLDFNEVVQEVMPLLRGDLVEHGVEVQTELGTIPNVRGDRVQLQQVFINLMINGCDAMESTPIDRRVLTVRSGTDGTGAWVSVTDAGPGIEPSLHGRLFEPFVTTKRHGMGLGLAVCRTIVEAHGGRIHAKNNPEGGATLTFAVPIADGGEKDG